MFELFSKNISKTKLKMFIFQVVFQVEMTCSSFFIVSRKSFIVESVRQKLHHQIFYSEQELEIFGEAFEFHFIHLDLHNSC